MNINRLKALQEKVKAEKLSALLVSNKTNVRYLSGFNGTSGFILVTPKKSMLLTDFRYIQKAKAILPKQIELVDITRMMRNPKGFKQAWQDLLKKHKLKNIGFEANNMTVDRLDFYKKISQGTKLVKTCGLTEELRVVKDKEELKNLAISQRVNEATLSEVIQFLKEGVSEQEIASKIQIIGRELGAEDMSFDPIVAFAESSASPHHEPTSKKLKKNQVVLIDMGMKYKGYCSDMTRTFLPKKATDKQKEIYSTVLEAQENCIKKLKAGTIGETGDGYSRSIIEKAGYSEYFGHSTGHGIGYDIHEAPNQSPKAKDPLPENTVVTVEPGIYLPGKFGVRIEDMVIVRKKDVEVITRAPKALEKIMIL